MAHDGHRLNAAEEPGDCLRVFDGCGESNALCGLFEERVEAFEGDRQVCAAFGGGEVVNLIHDHGGHAREGVAGGAGEHEVEGFGGGDENIGRVADELAAFACGGVAAAHAHADVRFVCVVSAQACDSGQRCAQIAFNIGAECFEGRDVEDARAACGSGFVFAVQGVECPEEGSEGFAGAGGGNNEGVVAVADALPGAFLGSGGCAEGGAEPVAYGGGEMGECVGHVSIMAGFMVCTS